MAFITGGATNKGNKPRCNSSTDDHSPRQPVSMTTRSTSGEVLVTGIDAEAATGSVSMPDLGVAPCENDEPHITSLATTTMSLHWIKHKLHNDPTRRLSVPDTTTVVTESLLMELDQQIHEISNTHRTRELQQRREQGLVDYTWLVSRPSKTYKMPQVERFELEELCSKVLPHECGRIIEVFRVSMAREPPVQEIPRILRHVIVQTLEERPRDDDSSWISKSLVGLRAMTSSNRVVPVSAGDEEMELTGPPLSIRAQSADPIFTVQDEMDI